jgi:superfamily II RNA helicase
MESMRERKTKKQRFVHRSAFGREKRPKRPAPRDHRPPKLHPQAQSLLADIGTPEKAPFRPDPFQIEALHKIIEEDVVVSAPTGSGKTWIALEAAKHYLAAGKGVWYATPLKALSNAKYEEFGDALGAERVGILTGDRKENPDAPVIVGTTEILRNQLYDAMDEGIDLGVDLVILDEAHYMSDPERGVVWEEVLIYLSHRVRIMLLSATIPNAVQLARWLAHIRGVPCAVVHSDVRPVPLHVLFRTPNGELTPFLHGRGLFPKVARFVASGRRRGKFTDTLMPDVNGIVETLREFNLLPAIMFLKSRADCDKALEQLHPSPQKPEEGGFAEAADGLLAPYPELHGQRQVRLLLECRAGSHHAGQLPAWRLVVERLMAQGHVEVIFATSTVAAGVNFPARTVVIPQSDRFNGQSFVDLTATDFHQMTGRAGRRGMDKAGFTLIVPARFMNITLAKELLLSEPEPLRSRIAVNFSMMLNLLLSHDPPGILELLRLSFSAFHDNKRVAEKVQRRLVKEFRNHLSFLQELDYVDEKGNPTYDGRWAAKLRIDHPLLIAELIRDGAYANLDAPELAALVAPFVTDKEKDVLLSKQLWDASADLWKKFRSMMHKLKPHLGFMASRGFDVPPVHFWPCAAVFLWAQEADWTSLTWHVDADEGDLAMLILRTADHLRQLISLEGEQPELARTARDALQLLMRPPLI